MPASAGLFLVVEGVEGAGKTSQLTRLSARLRDLGVPHRVVREPGGTAAGERARDIVLDSALSVTAEAELLLYLAARAEFVRRVVKPALSADEVVLSDRYEISTLAYQGLARGLGLERVRALNEFATGGLKPDVTFLLVVDPVSGRGRQRGEADRLEQEDPSFHAAVARAYEQLADSEANVVRVDGEASPDTVLEAVWKELTRRWPERFKALRES